MSIHDPSRLPESSPSPKPPFTIGQCNTVFDAAEQHIIELVKREVRHNVKKKILDELETDIQAAVDKALCEITFNLQYETDHMRRTDQLFVLVEWVRCRQDKRKYRERRIIEEVTDA
jgi:hypothetical protein